jgi:hypothetical protein
LARAFAVVDQLSLIGVMVPALMAGWTLTDIWRSERSGGAGTLLQLPQSHLLDQMIATLSQDQVGARPRRQDILA